jgi:hypothetical protein
LIGYGRLTDNAFMRRPWLTLAVLLLLVLVAQSGWACPTCKDNLAADPASANLARGFYYSILFMLSMPYLILTGIGLYFYSLVRKARLEREAGLAKQAALSSDVADACEPVAEDCPGPATVVEEEDDELVGV